MPRQDVPYGGAICRLKERIAEIWDKLDQKLHSINGVEGDGAGNVDIVSGDAAVVINNDQIGHRIEVTLDSSKLPAAAVSSVNGQTGAVRLDAADIPSNGNSNVQADLTLNKETINALNEAIGQEETARQNADATLQGNINSVQASIPGAAAAAVSNDPTVAQLAADVPSKLDKITSGSALKAYTHTGQNQGETSVVNGVDANSIGLRDANGRMQAADPAAGATDKTLVTANWVSQTGDSGPNNLVHRSGTETINGIKAANALKFVGIVANETANTDYLLLKHSLTNTTQDYRCILQICKTSPVICQLIYLDYKITDDRIVTLNDSRQTTLTNYNYTNTSTYSIYIENNQACIAIRTSQNQGIACNVIANWVGGRFGVISDLSEQGDTAVIPTQHAEVTI